MPPCCAIRPRSSEVLERERRMAEMSFRDAGEPWAE